MTVSQQGQAQARGRYHNLADILLEVATCHAQASMQAVSLTSPLPMPWAQIQAAALPQIGWGRASQRARRRSIRLGSYHMVAKRIRIHPALDQGWVPRFFVAYVVFHELLHHWIPPQRHASGWRHHPPAFQQAERAYPDYDRARQWERQHIGRLLCCQRSRPQELGVCG